MTASPCPIARDVGEAKSGCGEVWTRKLSVAGAWAIRCCRLWGRLF